MTAKRIDLYEDIGLFGMSSQRFCELLRRAEGQDIELHINSPGGEVFEGFAIANALKTHKGRKVAIVDGLCASAATFPAMVCDELHMHAQSMLMIHEPWSLALGSADELEGQAELLRNLTDLSVKLYQAKCGASPEAIRSWLSDETWMTPEQAKGLKLCDAVIERPAKVDARAMARFVARFKNPPAHLRGQLNEPPPKPAPPPAPAPQPARRLVVSAGTLLR